jgi:hypothetical protein
MRRKENATLMLERLLKPGIMTDDSGESIVQFGGDDMTDICAGTVAAKFVKYSSNFIIICSPNLT